MSELQSRLEKLVLRLDLMGMRVQEALADALHALRTADAQAGRKINRRDSLIDREEVEIEQECIRLLALYQPTAIDLRTICTIIKVNSDLERIADLAASVAKRVRRVVACEINMDDYPAFDVLAAATTDILGRTVRMIRASDAETARAVIDLDDQVDAAFKGYVRSALDAENASRRGAESLMTLLNLGKAMERIGDHCTNIAEDVIFLRTGDIVRHSDAMHKAPDPHTS